MAKFSTRKKVLMILFAVAALTTSCIHTATRSDSRAQSQAVKLISATGSCSGEQIEAPSGKTYILTAGHCKILRTDHNTIVVETENKVRSERAIIAEDSKSDLLLLEGVPNIDGLQIADSWHQGDIVRTFTHGSGYDTYKTEGRLVQLTHINIGLCIVGLDCMDDCVAEKYLKVPTREGPEICVVSVDEVVSTAKVVPGSSGGMVVNTDGDLVAVVSATNADFSMLVSLKDIKAFIAGY